MFSFLRRSCGFFGTDNTFFNNFRCSNEGIPNEIQSFLVKTCLYLLHEALKEDEAVDEVSLVEDVETHEVGVVRLVLRTAHDAS